MKEGREGGRKGGRKEQRKEGYCLFALKEIFKPKMMS